MADQYPEEWVDIEKKTMKYALAKPMWEILIPAYDDKEEFTIDHHKVFDGFVKEKAGGITILRGAKGEWISPEGELYKDKIIPCRICCSFGDIKSIMEFALEHYNQKTIMAYKISDHVLMIRRDQK
jgi:hypothetical protein